MRDIPNEDKPGFVAEKPERLSRSNGDIYPRFVRKGDPASRVMIVIGGMLSGWLSSEHPFAQRPQNAGGVESFPEWRWEHSGLESSLCRSRLKEV